MIKRSSVTEVSSTEMTTLYTVPEGVRTELVMLWITNPDTVNKNFHLEFYNSSSDTTIVLLDDYKVNQKDFVQIGGLENTFVIMNEGDKLKATGSSNSNFKVVLSFKEHNNIVQNL